MKFESLNIKDLSHHVTTNFSYEEFFKSATADSRKIQNIPQNISNLSAVCSNVCKLGFLLEQIRSLYSYPIRVSSGYRTARLNSAVGGVSNSLHMVGAAADLVVSDFSRLNQVLSYVQAKTSITEITDHSGHLFRIVPENGWIHIQLESVGQRLSVSDFISHIQSC